MKLIFKMLSFGAKCSNCWGSMAAASATRRALAKYLIGVLVISIFSTIIETNNLS